MRHFRLRATTILFVGCCAFSSISCTHHPNHDPQILQIYYHFWEGDELNTFAGTFKKDLVLGGFARTDMWLTTREQEILLAYLMDIDFFSFPETLYREHEIVAVQPDVGSGQLRIKYYEKDKTVTWEAPIDSSCKEKSDFERLQFLLWAIIESKPEYKALPPQKGHRE